MTQHPIIQWVNSHQDKYTAQKISQMKLSQTMMPTRYATWCTTTPTTKYAGGSHQSGWMPYLNAGLLCEGWLVTKKQDCHINTAATATTLQDTIIKDSKRQDPTIDTEWTEDTFKSVDWQANGSSFKALTPGQHLQISKYAHEWTPTMHHWAQISNKIDQWCFACGHLKENVQHMLLCPSGCRQAARSKAINKFCTHLS
jgi:hypothetical protein